MTSPKIPQNVDQDLAQLYDNLLEFNDYCSFLCDAIPSLLSEEADVDMHTLQGARRHCSDVKLRAEALTLDLRDIQDRLGGTLSSKTCS